MPTRRVLITGLSTYWGGRLAQALEQDEDVEAIIGVDNRDPTRELDRTEFVRVGTQHALLRRIVEAAEIDTVVDSRLVVDSVTTSPRKAHENNVIGTMNILAACSGSTATSSRPRRACATSPRRTTTWRPRSCASRTCSDPMSARRTRRCSRYPS